MPAYNYFPATYQPYQPVYQAQPSVPQTSIIWVSGEREAQMYPVAPNNAVTLWSQTEPVVYLKQADATGKPTLKVYDLVERSVAPPAPDKPVPDYATKSDLTALNEALDELKDEMAVLKRRTSRRREETEE